MTFLIVCIVIMAISQFIFNVFLVKILFKLHDRHESLLHSLKVQGCIKR